MNHKIKIILITAIIVAIITSIPWFLLLKSRSQQTEEEYIFSMKQKCREVGSKLYEQDVEELGLVNVLNPEYYYNKELNTCLYTGGQVQKDYLEKWVKDSLTNKWIIAFIRRTIDGEKRVMSKSVCPECLSTNEEFERQKQELFSQ